MKQHWKDKMTTRASTILAGLLPALGADCLLRGPPCRLRDWNTGKLLHTIRGGGTEAGAAAA